MIETTKRQRLWHWCCSRGFVFIGYVMVAVASIALYLESPPPPIGADFTISGIAAFIAMTLILAALASAHAVIYGLHKVNIFLIKLEIPSLRLLAFVIGLHGLIDMADGDVPSGAVQVGLATLLVHEMRLLSITRKGATGVSQ